MPKVDDLTLLSISKVLDSLVVNLLGFFKNSNLKFFSSLSLSLQLEC